MRTHSMFISTLLAAALMTFAPTLVQAQRINQRLKNEHLRIKQGVKSGELSRRQARELRSELRAIRSTARNERRSEHGRLTPHERADLNMQLDRVSHQIYRAKHPG